MRKKSHHRRFARKSPIMLPVTTICRQAQFRNTFLSGGKVKIRPRTGKQKLPSVRAQKVSTSHGKCTEPCMGVDRAWIKSRNPAHRPGHTNISQELIGHIPESGEGETVAVIRLHVNVKIPDRLLSRHRNESAANLVFQITTSLQPEKANKLPVLGSQETQRVVAKPTSDNIWRPRKLALQGNAGD